MTSGLRVGVSLLHAFSATPAATHMPQSTRRPIAGSQTPTQTPSTYATGWVYRIRSSIGDVPGYNGRPCAILGLPQGSFPSQNDGSWGGARCFFSSLATAQEVCLAAPLCCGVTGYLGSFEPRLGRADGSCILGEYTAGASPWWFETESWLRGYHSSFLTPSPTPNNYCADSLFRTLPRMDLVGTLVGTALSPGSRVLLPSASDCRQACCDAPACDGFSFAASDLGVADASAASCFLLVNITQLIPNNAFSSGIYESTL